MAHQILGVDTSLVSFPQFGPGIAALVMLRLFRKDQVKLSMTLKRVHPLKYLVALAIPLVAPVNLVLVYNQFVAPISIPSVNGMTFAMMLGGIMLGIAHPVPFQHKCWLLYSSGRDHGYSHCRA